jgi:rod shape determining protein RodA
MGITQFINKITGGNEIALIAALLLQGMGIMALISATQGMTHSQDLASPLLRQLLWIAIGIVVCGITLSISPKILQGFSYIIYFLAVLALISVLLLGQIGMGADRWLIIGPFRFQPSEFAKLALILALARLLTERGKDLKHTGTLVSAIVMTALCMGLVLVEPDLGTSLVYPLLMFLMLFWAGVPPVTLLIIASPIAIIPAGFHWITLALVLIAIAIVLYFARTRLMVAVLILAALMGIGLATPTLWSHLHEYQQRRILSFLNPGSDPMGSAYQLIQSKVTIGSGGFAGKGFLKGTQTHLKFLPEQHTDFIFSVWGEEFGFLGSLVVLIAYLILVIKAYLLSAKVRNAFLGAMCAGIAAFFLVHCFVNIGMTLGMLPVTGLPLPFMSYGGSMLITSWILVGLMTAAARHWREY